MSYDLDKHDKVHLWVGSNFLSKQEYEGYFKLDYSTEGDFDDPNYKVCEFCIDVGIKWYDEDFIGIVSRRNQEVRVEEVLKDASLEPAEFTRAKTACVALGVSMANAIFWYADADFSLKMPIKSSYNGLKYIGLFEAS